MLPFNDYTITDILKNTMAGEYKFSDKRTLSAEAMDLVDQLLQIKNVTKINQFIQVFQNNVETDLSFQNILWFAQQAILGGLSMENVEFVTMPNRTASCWPSCAGMKPGSSSSR